MVNPHHQPYDSVLKDLFNEEAAGILSCLVPGLCLTGPGAELNVEILRTTLTTDKLYRASLYGKPIILDPEFQVRKDDKLRRRLMAYHACLHLEHEIPVLPVVVFPFDFGSEDLFYEDRLPGEGNKAGKAVASIRPHVICLRNLDTAEIVRKQQISCYPLLSCTNKPEFPLLQQAIRQMHEHYSAEQFHKRMIWFRVLMVRTTMMEPEEKQQITEFLRMNYQQLDDYDLLLGIPAIADLAAKNFAEGEIKGEIKGKIEGEIKGEIKGLQEAILGLIMGQFPIQVVSAVQKAVSPVNDPEQLKTFFRKIAKVSDEQEVQTLLSQSFPKSESPSAMEAEAKSIVAAMRDRFPSDELLLQYPAIAQIAVKTFTEGEIKGEAEGLRKSILDVIGDIASADLLSQVEQAILPVQDIEKLREFNRKVARASNEQEISALLTQFFPPEQAKIEENPAEDVRQLILAFANQHFSHQIVSAIQQAIAPVQSTQQLSKFLHKLFAGVDEQEVPRLLALCFPMQKV